MFSSALLNIFDRGRSHVIWLFGKIGRTFGIDCGLTYFNLTGVGQSTSSSPISSNSISPKLMTLTSVANRSDRLLLEVADDSKILLGGFPVAADLVKPAERLLGSASKYDLTGRFEDSTKSGAAA